MRQPRPPVRPANAKRLDQLAAAIEAHRSGQPRRRLTRGLRARVVAAIDAGATVQAVSEACKVSRSQITRWKQAAARSGKDVARASAPTPISPRVLSVVDAHSRIDAEIELCIGGWHVSLRRAAQ